MKQTLTNRGFDLIEFKDAYDKNCSLQRSSSVVPHIWLGIDDAEPSIMASKTTKGGTGWIPYNIPNDVLLTTRMHIDTKLAWSLGWKLIKFAIRRKI